jgi:acyl transferase domain-containing protein
MEEILDEWLESGRLEELMDIWVKGIVFDWSKLYIDVKPSRISLPTYPFSRESYWIPKSENSSFGISSSSNTNNGTQNFAPSGVNQGDNNFASLRSIDKFDVTYYDNLLDEIIKGNISAENAARKVRNSD